MLVLVSPRFGSLSSSVLAELTIDKIDDRKNTNAKRRANIISAENSNTGWNRYSSDSVDPIVLHASGHRTNGFQLDFLRIRKRIPQ